MTTPLSSDYRNSVKVSVVMAIYNEPLQWIRLSVDSILNQSFTDFEFIIVCDNPLFTDGIKYIEDIAQKDSRVKLIINNSNLGPTKSFNIAIDVAQGEYIARMDADDISLPERFARQVAYLDSHRHISVCASDVHLIDEDGNITKSHRYRKKRRQALNIISNSMAHPSVIFRKKLLEERIPIYNEDYIYTQDYELWMFLMSKGHRFHVMEEVLLLYRKSRNQISSSKRQTQLALFKKAHKSFITKWLLERNIITDNDRDNLPVMLKKSSTALSHIKEEEKEYMTYIVYVLYFSLGTYSWYHRFRYLFDRNMIVFRIRFSYTFKLLTSRKTRRNLTGFN